MTSKRATHVTRVLRNNMMGMCMSITPTYRVRPNVMVSMMRVDVECQMMLIARYAPAQHKVVGIRYHNVGVRATQCLPEPLVHLLNTRQVRQGIQQGSDAALIDAWSLTKLDFVSKSTFYSAIVF